MGRGLARGLLALARRWVPERERGEWTREWLAELDALERLHGAGQGAGYPGPLAFAAGAVRHAWWLRTRGWTMDGLMQDLRYGWRRLWRAPGLTLVAAVTLALGVGANGAMFSLVNGLVLRPPSGMAQPERLVQVARSYDQAPRWDSWSSPALALMDAEAGTLTGVAGYSSRQVAVGQGADTEPLPAQYVTGKYFDVLGVRPALGRLLQPSDDVTPGAHPVAVLGHGLWQRRFGGDPAVVGRTVWVGAEPLEIVGVAPRDFAGPEVVGAAPALWIPAMQFPGYYGELPFGRWGFSWLTAVGRLRDGVTLDEARASMERVTARLREATPENGDIRVLLAGGVGLSPDDRQEARRISMFLLGIVGAVLLLTCMNVANLFLARAAARTPEVGVRKALGAGQARLARQLLTETVLLAGLATLLAVPLLSVAARFLPLVVPYTLAASMEPDVRVYTFLGVTGLATGLLFGVAPAWLVSRASVAGALRRGRGQGTRPGTRLRHALVVGQLALSLGLVAGAGLLGRSVRNARAAQPGFDPENLAVAFADLEATGRYDADTGREALDRMLAEIGALPGVTGVTVANQAPIVGGHTRASVQPPGRDDVSHEAEYVLVGPRYFETLGIRVLAGRGIGGFDEETDGVVVNRALAELFWPGQDPLGQELVQHGTVRVVGVVDDVQMRSLRSPGNPAVYHPMSRVYDGRVAFHVRTRGGDAQLARSLREAVATVDPALPLIGVVSLGDALAASMGETRTLGFLMGAFAALALILAVVGLYGVVSFAVSTRVRELGVRAALGASPRALVGLVLGRGMALTLTGLAAGVAVALAVGRAFEGLLYGVAGTDPVTLVVAALFLAGSAALASWLPARRAGRVDAVVSLREGVDG